MRPKCSDGASEPRKPLSESSVGEPNLTRVSQNDVTAHQLRCLHPQKLILQQPVRNWMIDKLDFVHSRRVGQRFYEAVNYGTREFSDVGLSRRYAENV